jgi:hypothetical protein
MSGLPRRTNDGLVDLDFCGKPCARSGLRTRSIEGRFKENNEIPIFRLAYSHSFAIDHVSRMARDLQQVRRQSHPSSAPKGPTGQD